MHLIKQAFLIFVLIICVMGHAQEVHSAGALVRAMHDRYGAVWYQSITFTQKNTGFKSDGTQEGAETWYNAGVIPGKWRIDLGSPESGNGYVMVDGTLTIIQKDKVAGVQPHTDMLNLLSFDIYKQDPETTIEILKKEGVDLSQFHEETWEGKPVYVIGAKQGDLDSKQLWVERDTLVFVREIEPVPSDPGEPHDIRLTHYHPLAGGWFADSVEVYTWDGKQFFLQQYSDVHADVKLAPTVFDPQQFRGTHWER